MDADIRAVVPVPTLSLADDLRAWVDVIGPNGVHVARSKVRNWATEAARLTAERDEAVADRDRARGIAVEFEQRIEAALRLLDDGPAYAALAASILRGDS